GSKPPSSWIHRVRAASLGSAGIHDIIIGRLMPSLRLPVVAAAFVLGLLRAQGAAAQAAPATTQALLPSCPDQDAAERLAANPPPQRDPDLANEDWQVVDWGTIEIQRNGRISAGGGVRLLRDDREVSTERLTVHEDHRSIQVEGGLTYRDPELVVSGESGTIEDTGASFEGARFELPLKPARGGAD